MLGAAETARLGQGVVALRKEGRAERLDHLKG